MIISRPFLLLSRPAVTSRRRRVGTRPARGVVLRSPLYARGHSGVPLLLLLLVVLSNSFLCGGTSHAAVETTMIANNNDTITSNKKPYQLNADFPSLPMWTYSFGMRLRKQGLRRRRWL
jgi:hypothetical protein